MDIVLGIVLYGAPWALVVMGAAVAVKQPPPEDRRAQWRWIIAFGVVGAMVTGAQVWSDHRDREARKELEARLTGGDNYCYFEALLGAPEPRGGYEWQLRNRNQRPIPNVQICLYLNEKFKRCWDQGMCVPHAINQAKDEGALPLGSHRFEFFGANSWSQTLEIYLDNGVPKQRGKIKRGDTVIGTIPHE